MWMRPSGSTRRGWLACVRPSVRPSQPCLVAQSVTLPQLPPAPLPLRGQCQNGRGCSLMPSMTAAAAAMTAVTTKAQHLQQQQKLQQQQGKVPQRAAGRHWRARKQQDAVTVVSQPQPAPRDSLRHLTLPHLLPPPPPPLRAVRKRKRAWQSCRLCLWLGRLTLQQGRLHLLQLLLSRLCWGSTKAPRRSRRQAWRAWLQPWPSMALRREVPSLSGPPACFYCGPPLWQSLTGSTSRSLPGKAVRRAAPKVNRWAM
mmetsp:Transcript_13135/g.39737  ORF Transcript_13135/g.39737 Transcript_13135/m.39737 type:complete len:256 (-) Transcript_13135:261-1028(-)